MSVGQTKLGKFQMPQVGDTLEGRYEINAVLATGGMGVILRAQHMRMGREVAVKILHPHIAQNEEVLARFEREVRLAQRLNHINTIRLYDFGEAENGLIYVVMELLEGADLKEVLRQEKTLSVGRAVDLTLQVLDGLGEAHEQDFVHRDLKPSNLFLCEDRRGGDQIKILDFGIAKSLEETASEITKTGSICGTAAYVAPEYLHDPSPTKAADVYAVGLILLEMITGKRAFHGTTTAQTLMMQMQREIQVPQSLVNTPIAEVISRSTQKDPMRRYLDADEMFQALDAVADQVPADLRLDRNQVGEVLRPLSSSSMTMPTACAPLARDDSSSALPQPTATPASGEFSPSSDTLGEGDFLDGPVADDAFADQKTLVTPQPSSFDAPQQVPPPRPPSHNRRSDPKKSSESLGKRLTMVAVALVLAAGGSIGAWALLGSDESQDDSEGQQASEATPEEDGAAAERDELAQEPTAVEGKPAAAEERERVDGEEGDPVDDAQIVFEEDELEEDVGSARDEQATEASAEAEKPAPREKAAPKEAHKPKVNKRRGRSNKERNPPKRKSSSDDGEENVDEFLDEYL